MLQSCFWQDVEAEKLEISSVPINKATLALATECYSSSVGASGGQLLKASSCSALPTTDLAFPAIVDGLPKQDESFADLFVSADISDTLIDSLCSSGTSVNGAGEFLESLSQSNQLDEFGLKKLDLPPHDVDHTQDMVDHLQLVDSGAGHEKTVGLTGQNWTEQQQQQLPSIATSSSSLLDGDVLGQKFGSPDQSLMASRRFQRMLQAASQLSIAVPCPPPPQGTIASESATYGHVSSNLIAYTNPGSLIPTAGSLTSPSQDNTPTAPLVAMSGKSGHPILLKNQPLTPGYTVHLPPGPLHQFASTVYPGNQTPCTPNSPFEKSFRSQISGPSQMSSNSVFFQFPSQPGDKENAMASHSSTPNLPSYGMHPPHTPQTPHSPYTPSTPKYTSNASTLTRHFQFPPSANFLDGSTSSGSPYPHYHSKSYHPYSRPLPASPWYINQSQASSVQQQEDILQVEQKIHEHIQLLQREDLMKQKMSLQAQDCIAAETTCDDFSILGSMFVDENLGNQPEVAIGSSAIEMQEYLDGIGQEPSSFDVEMDLTSSCPVIDSLNTINPSELSVLLGDQPGTIPACENEGQMSAGVEEVIQLLREQLGDAICGQDLGVASEPGTRQESVKLETSYSRFEDDIGRSGVLPFYTSTAMTVDCSLMVSPKPLVSADMMDFEFTKTETSEKKGRKHRPEPLHIPANVNSYGFASQLRSPRLRDTVWKRMLPYTPPPMISPARKGPGVFWNLFPNSMPQSAPPCNHSSQGKA